jgi:hypothetical protein
MKFVYNKMVEHNDKIIIIIIIIITTIIYNTFGNKQI